MSMIRQHSARDIPTVELSVVATSEELELLAAAAQRRHMSLKDFLRLQVISAAKLAAKSERALSDARPANPGPALGPMREIRGPGPAFLP